MKQIWYIERKNYRVNKKGITEQIADAGIELNLYEKYATAKTMFDAYKINYTMQDMLIDEENFPNEAFSVQSKKVKEIYTIYTLRPVKLKETMFDE